MHKEKLQFLFNGFQQKNPQEIVRRIHFLLDIIGNIIDMMVDCIGILGERSYCLSMNNFRYTLNKVKRNSLERSALSVLRASNPNFEQYVSAHRYPTVPKIVLYSSLAGSDSFLQNIFPFYALITPTPTAETDEVITRRIAEQLTSADEAADAKFGFIVRGFPFNTNQALLLDRYLNGVNLAIHLKNPSDAADYATSVRPLLDYYDERGALLELTHSGENKLAQIEEAFDQIKTRIKRSV